MHRQNISIVTATLVALSAAGCERSGVNPRPEQAAVDSPVAVPAAASMVRLTGADSQPGKPFACTPETVSAGDTITLRMKTPHGGYLSVTRADGTVYFIVYPSLGDRSRRFSLVSSEAFKQIRTFLLPVDVRVPPRVYARDTIPEGVFNTPGKYELLMGENLEGDFGAEPLSCHVSVVKKQQ